MKRRFSQHADNPVRFLVSVLTVLLCLPAVASSSKSTTFLARTKTTAGWTSVHRGGGSGSPANHASHQGDGDGDGDGSSWLPKDEKTSTTIEFVKDTILHNGWRKLTNRQVRMMKTKTTSSTNTETQSHSSQHESLITVNFEIVSQGDRGGTVSDHAVLVFVWNSTHQTATLVEEYMPSVHDRKPGLAAGMVEAKHGNNKHAKEEEQEPSSAGAAVKSGDNNHSSIDSLLLANNDDGDNDHDSAILTAAQHELEEECHLQGGLWHRLCQPTVMDKYTTSQLSVYLVIDPVPVDHPKPRDATEMGMQILRGISVNQLERMVQQGKFTVVGGWAVQLALRQLRRMGEI